MVASSAVRVFIEVGSVKEAQSVSVFREMRRNPIQDDPNTGLVQTINEQFKPIRVTKTRSGRKITRQLVPPRRIIGVFHHRHKFDMGEAHIGDVLHQLLG